ncbi:hypothetical protein CR513_06221, partial [Mucuna pruriens]
MQIIYSILEVVIAARFNKVMMTTANYNPEKLTRKNDFGILRLKMRALLISQGLDQALGGDKAFPRTMSKAKN